MSDVTIPATTAKEWAAFIRNNAGGGRLAGLDDLADLLDPQPPSLRDEVARVLRETEEWEDDAAAVLGVVRRHVQALPVIPTQPPGGLLDRDDVLRLLGDSID